MAMNTISEAGFLLTELRYTLGQLHVQVLDLDAETRANRSAGGRSIDSILQEMLQQEDRVQQSFAQLLGTGVPRDEPDIPLPVNASNATPGLEHSFEAKRSQTIAMLTSAGENWPPDLVDAVKQQVQRDRAYTTEIAECRKAFFDQVQRPDLNEPLTTSS